MLPEYVQSVCNILNYFAYFQANDGLERGNCSRFTLIAREKGFFAFIIIECMEVLLVNGFRKSYFIKKYY